MNERVKQWRGCLLAVAVALTVGGCDDAGTSMGDSAAQASAQSADEPAVLRQQTTGATPAVTVSNVSAAGVGCNGGAMNVFTGRDYVHFFLTDLRLQSKSPPTVDPQQAVCNIKARIKGTPGVAYRLRRVVTLGAIFLDPGATGTYATMINFDGVAALSSGPGALRQVKGPYFDAWTETYNTSPLVSKCGQDAAIDLTPSFLLSGAAFGVVEMSDAIVNFERVPCTR